MGVICRPIRVRSLPSWPRATRPKGPRQPKRESELERAFHAQLVAEGLDVDCVREHVYAPPRKFRADFAFPSRRLLVELQGGIWAGKSGHSGGSGITKDIERGNAATLAGWRVLRFAPEHIRTGSAVRVVRAALEAS